MIAAPTVVPVVDGIAPIAANSDAWICDIWGVIHNGVQAHAKAIDACRRFREAGGTVILLTNAPRPGGAIRMQLDQLNVPATAWDDLVTSGDLTRSLIEAQSDRKIFHLGPERDRGLFDEMDLAFSDAPTAGAVVCTGLFDDTTETPDDYSGMLADLRRRNVPLICANPDIKVERGGHIIYCAGALAEAYAALGGEVIWSGKPHLPVYERCFDLIAQRRGSNMDRRKILAIGDGVRTDIAGAAAAGIPAVFVASAIHVQGSVATADLASLFAGIDRLPIAAMDALAW